MDIFNSYLQEMVVYQEGVEEYLLGRGWLSKDESNIAMTEAGREAAVSLITGLAHGFILYAKEMGNEDGAQIFNDIAAKAGELSKRITSIGGLVPIPDEKIAQPTLLLSLIMLVGTEAADKINTLPN